MPLFISRLHITDYSFGLHSFSSLTWLFLQVTLRLPICVALLAYSLPVAFGFLFKSSLACFNSIILSSFSYSSCLFLLVLYLYSVYNSIPYPFWFFTMHSCIYVIPRYIYFRTNVCTKIKPLNLLSTVNNFRKHTFYPQQWKRAPYLIQLQL